MAVFPEGPPRNRKKRQQLLESEFITVKLETLDTEYYKLVPVGRIVEDFVRKHPEKFSSL